MDVGTALQWIAVASAVGTLAATVSGRHRAALLASAVAAVASVLVAGRLAQLHLGRRYEFEQVAANVDDSMSWWFRLASTWSGAAGSLIVFVAIVAPVLVAALVTAQITARRRDGGDGRVDASIVTAVTIAGLTLTSVFAAPAFEVLDTPPLDGEGISPILDHWAMLVHPPLLYLGMTLSLLPVLASDERTRRRRTHVAAAVLTLALGLGAAWAYVELGWGGWWAWDPVENVGLVVWLLLIAALHSPAGRARQIPLALAWPAVAAGTALTRTSLRTSVHAFADAGGLGWWLWPLTALAACAAFWWLRGSPVRPIPRRTVGAVATLWLAAVVVAAGTYRPFLSGTTDGWFYARLLAPLSVAGALAMVLTGRRRGRSRRHLISDGVAAGVAGVLVALAVGADVAQAVMIVAIAVSLVAQSVDVRASATRLLAHLGILLVLIAAVAGTFATRTTLRLLDDGSAQVGGATLRLRDIAVADSGAGPADPILVVAEMTVDGEPIRPAITIHPARGTRLAEAGNVIRARGDVQLLLRDAGDDFVVVDVNVHPLQWTAWLGGALLVVAFALGAGVRQDRSRLRRSSSSMVVGAAGSAGGGGGTSGVGGGGGGASLPFDAAPSDEAGDAPAGAPDADGPAPLDEERRSGS